MTSYTLLKICLIGCLSLDHILKNIENLFLKLEKIKPLYPLQGTPVAGQPHYVYCGLLQLIVVLVNIYMLESNLLIHPYCRVKYQTSVIWFWLYFGQVMMDLLVSLYYHFHCRNFSDQIQDVLAGYHQNRKKEKQQNKIKWAVVTYGERRRPNGGSLGGSSADGTGLRDMFPQLHMLPPVRQAVCDPATGGVRHIQPKELVL